MHRRFCVTPVYLYCFFFLVFVIAIDVGMARQGIQRESERKSRRRCCPESDTQVCAV